MELQINVLNAFNTLTQRLHELEQILLQDNHLMAWIQFPTDYFHVNTTCPREQTALILNQLEYLDKQAPREILLCPGFIGASSNTLTAAANVNLAKQAFKQQMLALKAAKISIKDPYLVSEFETILNSRRPMTATVLKRLGLARLHLKQCYRTIPILTQAPQKISWTWANTRAIKKITISQAETLLLKKGHDLGIQMQLKKLAHLTRSKELAIVQELAPHLRVNLVFEQLGRKMIKGPIPIFFPCDATTPWPKFKPPHAKAACAQRNKRSDVRLEDTPYLPAIHAHLYL